MPDGARLSDLIRALEKMGVTVTPPSRGSHWKAEKAGHRSYPLPAHNGTRTVIADHYIRGVCRAFDLDEAALRSHL